MLEAINDTLERLKLNVRTGSVGFARRSFFFAPLAVGAVSFWLLAFVAQFHEIYRDIVQTGQFAKAATGLLSMAFFASVLYVWHKSVSTDQIDDLYPDHADPHLDRRLTRIREMLSVAAAALPMIGLATGVTLSFPREIAVRLTELAPALGSLPQYVRLTKELGQVKAGTVLVAVLAWAAAFALLNVLHRGFAKSVQDRLLAAAEIATVVFLSSALILPMISHDAVVVVAQALGPLGVSGLVLTAVTILVRRAIMIASSLQTALFGPLAFVFFSFAMSSRTVRRRMVNSIYATMFVLIGLFVYVNLFSRAATPELHSREARGKNTDEITSALRDWLVSRRDRGQSQRYPVFVVATQGGGIYAASAAATFLTQMETACPGFSQHIFAISGVSGGSVGSSVFNALMQRRPQVEKVDCLESVGSLRGNPGPDALTPVASQIILQDHLSPVLYTWLTDAVLGFVQLPLPPRWRIQSPGGREVVLERSFQRAFEAASGPVRKAVDGCGGPSAGSALSAAYSGHWCLASAAPALVLNATWTENGYRVAFSPFALHSIGDGTLFSFSEIEKIGSFGDCGLKDVSLAEAAVVSARFPAIMPSWTLNCRSVARGRGEAGISRIRGTFVDGGYADNSGAATALEIFAGLSRAAAAITRGGGAAEVDLRLILLTDAPSMPEAADNNGQWFGDTSAPVTTLLNVRELLARRAVTRAVSQLGRDDDNPVMIMQLDQDTFPLTLGWKISDTTNDLVRLMLGASGTLSTGCDNPMNAAVDIICKNSANVGRIKALLTAPR